MSGTNLTAAATEAASDSDSSIIRLAIEQGVQADVLEKLIFLQEKANLAQSRKEFYEALGEVRGECVKVVRNKRNSHTKNRYSDLAAYVEAASPVMSSVGLSHRWHTDTAADGRISVTCIISHRGGYEDSTTLSAMPDAGAGRNAVQAVGSTVKYLQRYTFAAIMGLADTDDDGQAAGAQTGFVSPDQLAQLQASADEVGADLVRFCAYMDVGSLAEIAAADFDKAMSALRKKGR